MDPKPNTVTIDLPKGMSKETFVKSMASFEKSRIYTAKRDKAVRAADKVLREKYPGPYKQLLAVELRKAGLPVK